MHRHTSPAGQYGLEMDGTIGLSAQPNGWLPSWPQFFAERRIGHMLRLARSQDPRSFPLGEKVIAALPKLLPERPPASLLHGDLWGGNAAAAKDGGVIFDPAPYYGDREADLAMTELFGRFPKPFYEGYNEEWPLEPGYNKRRTVYNLYHVMNHHVLFGGGYGRQAERMMEEILAWVAEKGA
ncbi:Fructosamine/Ketosamine-3-kinase [Hyaloraphidium curvatum]|nr:Fructosamine/Ketosamine-3-kinase [Hyaloraphidium curvatum]